MALFSFNKKVRRTASHASHASHGGGGGKVRYVHTSHGPVTRRSYRASKRHSVVPGLSHRSVAHQAKSRAKTATFTHFHPKLSLAIRGYKAIRKPKTRHAIAAVAAALTAHHEKPATGLEQKRIKRQLTGLGVAPRKAKLAAMTVPHKRASKVVKGAKVRRRVLKHLVKTTRTPTDTRGLTAAEKAVVPIVKRAAKKYGEPASLLMSQIRQESGFKAGQTSSAGAQGITQFIPSTAKAYGVKFGTSRSAIRSQIMGQAHYMADLGVKKDPTSALTRYSGGYATSAYADPIQRGAKDYKGVDRGGTKRAVNKKALARAKKLGISKQVIRKQIKPKGGKANPNDRFKSHYVNPYKHLTQGRVDMGVDYTGSGNVGAVGKARVVDSTTSSGWPGGGFVKYQLLTGPKKGKVIYVAENISPKVRVGQVVQKGETVAHANGGYPYLETGWAANAKTGDHEAAAHTYYTEGMATKHGKSFLAFLHGRPAGIAFGGGGSVGGVSGSTGSAPSGGATGTASAGGGRSSVSQKQATPTQPPPLDFSLVGDFLKGSAGTKLPLGVKLKAPATPKTGGTGLSKRKTVLRIGL